MRNILTIAQRELTSYFTSPMGYVAMFFFMGVCGIIYVLSTMGMGGPPKADMTGMFGSMVFLSLLICPVLTVALIAAETNAGTYELLMTRPVRDFEVVVGKYLGALALYLVIILVTIEFPIIYGVFGKPDWGQTLCGYLGIVLTGMAFIAIGVFASSLTSNQFAAAAMGIFILLFFWLIGWVGAGGSGVIGDVAKSISIYENFQDFQRGILSGKSLLFFFTLTGFFLFLGTRSLESRRTV